jgi:hypothetical protein
MPLFPHPPSPFAALIGGFLFSIFLSLFRSCQPRQSLRRTGGLPEPALVHTSLYLPGPVHDATRKIAYDERIKIHDVVVEGIDAALKRRGYHVEQG